MDSVEKLTIYDPLIQHKQLTRTDQKESIPITTITVPDNITPVHWELYQRCLQENVLNSYPIQLLNFLIQHADKQGMVRMPISEIATAAGIPSATVTRLISKFLKMDTPILIRHKSGKYQINSDLIKCDHLSHTFGIFYRHSSDPDLLENGKHEFEITDEGTH